ncbi:DUF2332 domain-containing protein [Prauserella rugosa]|uniref:DUF2332 domain-containing protein n=1 Tax=Prauserella rugosa TaxID=43354 RepID=A0A660CJ88_9PSEU|nr:DUF2332 domain-containing protein [Prauserella rugosa]KID28973.1 hypothetical protein HQ32_03664 [Prauserella sp. Am3]KMS85885.1 hypothetical protein ACZ91_39860 [Streptomyces regensis]TWH22494.1 hypothetical protein JD82_04375 [Prauserella rugosa]
MGEVNAVNAAKERLRRFAEHEAAGISPLYAHLAEHAADDDEIAGLLAEAGTEADAHPTLLFAVAHRLIQADPIHPLSRYYPSLGGMDGVDGATWPEFRNFLLERADRVRALVRERFTQTNEVNRAAVLYPAVARAAKAAKGKVGLLEIGCSAGLLLGMDRFAYQYRLPGGEQLAAGPKKTPVGLHCAVELADGAAAPAVPAKLNVAAKVGLDRHPVDAQDDEELAWLEACVWADQPDRIRMLRTAAAAQAKDTPELVEGDAVNDLATAAERVPEELPLVVFTSHVTAYLDADRREAFVTALGELAGRRRLWWASLEAYEAGLAGVLPGRDELAYAETARPTLGLVTWENDTPNAQALALADPHGQRMTWLGG